MLGKRIIASVYGKINEEGVYTGYIKSALMKNKTVYIVSRKKLSLTVNCVVIATAKKNADSGYNIILAPEREIFYEPDLKFRLKDVKALDLSTIICLYEKSCGALVINSNENEKKVLLIKNHNAKYWSFPKGHIEKDESEIQTAIREVKEETGLDIELYKHYRQISDYNPYGRIKKRVVFFMGESSTDEVLKQEEEIDSYKWVTFKQAEKLCSYENDIRILKTAQQYLRKSKKVKN